MHLQTTEKDFVPSTGWSSRWKRSGPKEESSSAAILDLDLHYGNGTASLVTSRPWIRALSIYGNDYVDNIPYRDVSVRRHDGR